MILWLKSIVLLRTKKTKPARMTSGLQLQNWQLLFDHAFFHRVLQGVGDAAIREADIVISAMAIYHGRRIAKFLTERESYAIMMVDRATRIALPTVDEL